MSRPFRFKRFTINQQRSAMKVGTDGVLLGAWCSVGHAPERILDVGTGTGLVALMLAQRTEVTGALIDAVEIDRASCSEARENVGASPWNTRIKVWELPIQQFATQTAGRYDLMVSNPPFFSDSLLPPDSGRTTARHTTSLTFDELASCAAALLAPDGVFSVIIPADRSDEFSATAACHGLRSVRITNVVPAPQSHPKRALMEFIRESSDHKPPKVDSLVIESNTRHEYSAEYVGLTRDFYLKF